jgi:hypothetical protein
MSEADRSAVDAALQTNPLAVAEAEGHLQKGLLMLSKEIGLATTANIVAEILSRLEAEMPARRLL